MNDVKITYRLYMWISSDVVIGNKNQDYTLDEWEDVYASIKVKVNGDFSEKTINVELTTEEKLIETAVSYSVASSSDFSGGLVAINYDGTLYNETDSTEEIREYRYTGLNVNNYIFLDTDGDGEESDNEIWRIVGIFKNSSNKWNLKLMRNTVLPIDEIPKNYIYEETSYKIRCNDSSNNVYFNNKNTAVNESDWTTAKLQYWLNDITTNGYYGTLSSSIQNIIDTKYIYYLGNNIYGNSGDTTISSYTNERLETNIWSGNKATWYGAIGLLYPSDYGYSANSSYWSDTILYKYNSKAKSTSWMQQNANHSSNEWLISPTSSYSSYSATWANMGYVGHTSSDVGQINFRPVINLQANAVSLDGLGTLDDVYKIN